MQTALKDKEEFILDPILRQLQGDAGLQRAPPARRPVAIEAPPEAGGVAAGMSENPAAAAPMARAVPEVPSKADDGDDDLNLRRLAPPVLTQFFGQAPRSRRRLSLHVYRIM